MSSQFHSKNQKRKAHHTHIIVNDDIFLSVICLPMLFKNQYLSSILRVYVLTIFFVFILE